MLPDTNFDFSSPHTTTTDFGMDMFSLVIMKLSNLTAIATPPPLFVPGWGVLKYFIPLI